MWFMKTKNSATCHPPNKWLQCLEFLPKWPTVKHHSKDNCIMRICIFMLNVDWCLLFNLLPQLFWHISNCTLQLNQRWPFIRSLSKCCGSAAHCKTTNTAFQQTEVCVIRGFEQLLIIQAALFIFNPLLIQRSRNCFWNCPPVLCIYQLSRTCNSKFPILYIHAMHWFLLFILAE